MSRWYESGLEFTCTKCGHCCSGAPGHVWLTGEEEERIAAKLGLSPEEFARTYVRQVGDRRSLIERPSGDCVFLSEDRACEIHDVKPRQCVVFPFWAHTVSSQKNWDAAAQRYGTLNLWWEQPRHSGIGGGPSTDAQRGLG